MKHTWSAIAAALLLSGCVAGPTRSDPSAFILIQQGAVPKHQVQAFTDCLTDGFNAAHFVITNTSVRQQRRTDGYRVETLTSGSLLMSADVNDDGRVQLLESKSAMLINTSGEREAFADCLQKSAGNQ